MTQKDQFMYKYLKVADLLQKELWRFKPGEAFFSDKEVALKFEVSYLTARQAMLTLAKDGLVERKAKKGTFVCDPNLNVHNKELKTRETNKKFFRVIYYQSLDSLTTSHTIYNDIFQMIAANGLKLNHDITLSSPIHQSSSDFIIDSIKEGKEDGVYVVGPIGEDYCKKLITIPNLKIVSLDHDYTYLGIDSICWNFTEIGLTATNYYLSQGIKNIRFLGANFAERPDSIVPNELKSLSQWPNSLEMQQGFYEALETAEIKAPPKISAASTAEDTLKNLNKIMKEDPKTELIISFSNLPKQIAEKENMTIKVISPVHLNQESLQIFSRSATRMMKKRIDGNKENVKRLDIIPTK